MMRVLLIIILLVHGVGDILGMEFNLAMGLSLKNLFMYLAFGLLLMQYAVSRRPKIKLAWLQGAFLVMVLYAAATVVINIAVLEIPHYSLMPQVITFKTQLFDRFVVFILFLNLVSSEEDVRQVLSVLLGVVAVGCLFTITNTWGLTSIGPMRIGNDDDVEGGRIFGYFGHANETGTMLATLIPAYIAMAENARAGTRMAWIAGLIAVAVMLVMTGSRGAMVGLVVGGGMAVYAWRRHFDRRRLRQWIALSTLVVIPMLLVIAWPSIQRMIERFTHQTSGHLGDASSGRTDLWGDALQVMMENPWTFITGFGWGGWDNQNFRYVAHNSYLSFWFDLGLPGLIGFILVLGGAALVARRAVAVASPHAARLLIAFTIGMSTLMVGLVFLNLTKPWPYLWAFIGLMLRLALLAHARTSEEKAPVPISIGTGHAGVISPAGRRA
jgi:O-antigen ligase